MDRVRVWPQEPDQPEGFLRFKLRTAEKLPALTELEGPVHSTIGTGTSQESMPSTSNIEASSLWRAMPHLWPIG